MIKNSAASKNKKMDQETKWRLWLILGFVLFLAVGLRHFPYPFLASEAAPLVLAEDLLTQGFRFHNGLFFPVYFQFKTPMDLGSLVYLIMIPLISFGKQIWVVRGLSIAASLLTGWWLTQIAKKHLGLKHHFLIFFVMASVPAWIFLSRLGNSDILRAAAFTAFFYYYLEYRYVTRKAIIKCLISALILFYVDFNGQVLMLVNGLVFLVLDFRYHWQRKKFFLLTLGIFLLTLSPGILYLLFNPQVVVQKLASMQPVWNQSGSTMETVWKIILGLLNGLNPLNWAAVQNSSAPAFPLGPFRGLPLFYLFLLPVGLFFLLTMIKKPIGWFWVMLFSPVVYSLLQPFSPYEMAAVLPVYFLLIGITLNAFFFLLSNKLPHHTNWLFPLIMGLMVGYGFFFLQQALAHQQDWVNHYEVEKIRIDSQDFFEFIKQYETAHPEKKYALNRTWSDHPEILRQFFAADIDGVEYDVLNGYIDSVRVDLKDTLFLLDQKEMDQVRDSDKFMKPFILKTYRFNDGLALYYFVELTYKPEIKSIIQAELETRREPRKETLRWMGQSVDVYFPALEIGPITNLVDGDEESLIKSDRVNPLNLVFEFSEPISLSEVQFLVGSEAMDVFITIYPTESQEPLNFSRQSGPSQDNKTIYIPLEKTFTVSRLEVVVQDKKASESAPIHLWEIQLNP
jgi:hypothetical protein